MPVRIGKAYDTTWRGRPPAMLANDVPVWYRFVDTYGYLFQRVWYDAELGGPHLTTGQVADPYEKMWRRLTSKRCDAIVETERELWIIEVALSAGLRALGQLLTYRVLYLEDPPIVKPEQLLIVCEVIDPDTAVAAATYGVLIYVV